MPHSGRQPTSVSRKKAELFGLRATAVTVLPLHSLLVKALPLPIASLLSRTPFGLQGKALLICGQSKRPRSFALMWLSSRSATWIYTEPYECAPQLVLLRQFRALRGLVIRANLIVGEDKASYADAWTARPVGCGFHTFTRTPVWFAARVLGQLSVCPMGLCPWIPMCTDPR